MNNTYYTAALVCKYSSRNESEYKSLNNSLIEELTNVLGEEKAKVILHESSKDIAAPSLPSPSTADFQHGNWVPTVVIDCGVYCIEYRHPSYDSILFDRLSKKLTEINNNKITQHSWFPILIELTDATGPSNCVRTNVICNGPEDVPVGVSFKVLETNYVSKAPSSMTELEPRLNEVVDKFINNVAEMIPARTREHLICSLRQDIWKRCTITEPVTVGNWNPMLISRDGTVFIEMFHPDYEKILADRIATLNLFLSNASK